MSTKQSNLCELCCFVFEEPAVEVGINVVVESARVSTKTGWACDSPFPREDLENKHPECIDVTFVSEPASGGVLWGQVAHGGSGLERREDNIIGEKLVQARIREQRVEPLVDENLLG